MQRWLRQRCRAISSPRPAPATAAPDIPLAWSAAASATAWRPPPAQRQLQRQLQRQALQLVQVLVVLAIAALLPGCSGGPRYSSRLVQTKYGSVRGVIVQLNSRRLEPVEVSRPAIVHWKRWKRQGICLSPISEKLQVREIHASIKKNLEKSRNVENNMSFVHNKAF